MSEGMDEVDEIVARAQASDDSDDEGAPKRKPRKRRTSRQSDEEVPYTDEDVAAVLPDSVLPTVTEKRKTLYDMYAKYSVGSNPEFRVTVTRLSPKYWGKTKIDGYYDTYDHAITEEEIFSAYGGGLFRVAVMGPNPMQMNLPKHYDSVQVNMPGDPNLKRLPGGVAGVGSNGSDNGPPPLPLLPVPEGPKLSEVALKMATDMATAEREERRRIEDRMEARMSQPTTSPMDLYAPIVEAERRRADDVLQAERARGDAERRMMEERMKEERAAREQAERRHESESRGRPSVAEELRALTEAGLFRRDDGGAAKEMLSSLLERHRQDVGSLQENHGRFVEQIRTAHEREMEAMRASHLRELEAEREAGRAREARVEERLSSERQEKHRDQDRYREQMAERDQSWKDRNEQALAAAEIGWKSRLQSLTETYENRIQFLQQRIDELRTEVHELKSRQQEAGDIFTQIHKHKAFQEEIGTIFGKPAETPAASSGGIGLSGASAPPWVEEVLNSPVAERLVEKLFGGGGGGAPPPAPPQYTEGQVIQTPQGIMEVVRNPADGQLALAPKAALDQQRALMAQQQGRGRGLLGPPQQAPRRKSRVMPDVEDVAQQGGGGRHVSVVPNLSEGFPKRRPPWEGGGSEEEAVPQPRAVAPAIIPPAPAQPIELNSTERQVARMIAKEVHDSVAGAEDPDEFVMKMRGKYPAQALQQIVGAYSDQQVAMVIRQLEPNSAGATPAGQQFTLAAFRLLRESLMED